MKSSTLHGQFVRAFVSNHLSQLGYVCRYAPSIAPRLLECGKSATRAHLVEVFQTLGAQLVIIFHICFHVAQVQLGQAQVREDPIIKREFISSGIVSIFGGHPFLAKIAIVALILVAPYAIFLLRLTPATLQHNRAIVDFKRSTVESDRSIESRLSKCMVGRGLLFGKERRLHNVSGLKVFCVWVVFPGQTLQRKVSGYATPCGEYISSKTIAVVFVKAYTRCEILDAIANLSLIGYAEEYLVPVVKAARLWTNKGLVIVCAALKPVGCATAIQLVTISLA